MQGVEGGLVVHASEAVETYVNYTFRLPTIESDPSAPATEGRDVPLVPRRIGKAGVRWRPVDELVFDLGAEYIGSSYGNTVNTTHIPDYVLVGLSATWHIDSNVSMSVFGTNLLDEEYYSSVFASAQGGAAFEGLPLTVGMSMTAEF